MKDFNDFISSIPQERLAEIVNEAKSVIAETDLNESAVISFTVTKELLRDYHNWLNETTDYE